MINDFKNENSILDISNESGQLSGKLAELDVQKENIRRQLSYYDNLENYLITRDDYTNVPAPTVAGISEGSISGGVSKIIQLAEERSNYQYSLKENSPVFDDIDLYYYDYSEESVVVSDFSGDETLLLFVGGENNLFVSSYSQSSTVSIQISLSGKKCLTYPGSGGMKAEIV